MTLLVAIGALIVGAEHGALLGWLVFGISYLGSCWCWPNAVCWSCHGRGRHVRDDGKVWRPCRWCGTTGSRRRVGRVLWDAIAA